MASLIKREIILADLFLLHKPMKFDFRGQRVRDVKQQKHFPGSLKKANGH